MPNIIKTVLSVIALSIWGPYLLYVWMVPSAVPEWVTEPGMRRALMLSREFEPTIFTLLFGIGFTGLALAVFVKLALGRPLHV